jgi:PAS domain S-box-containing protein
MWSDAESPTVPLRERALVASQVSFTISDWLAPDNPLIWANQAFTDTTGYEPSDILGRNCRFLQGPDTDPAAVDRIRQALRSATPLTITLRNYRRDGAAFWNQLSLAPLRDPTGRVTHFVGVQLDVSDRIEAERARQLAYGRAEEASARLRLLSAFTRDIAATLDRDDVMAMLGRSVVPQLATWCCLYTLTDDDRGGRLEVPFLVHERASADPDVAAALARLRELLPSALPADGVVRRVLRGDAPYVMIDDDTLTEVTGSADEERLQLARRLGTTSSLVVPMLVRDQVTGALAVCSDDRRPPFGPDDVTVVTELAARAGMMLDNARLYRREHTAADTLQRGLVPVLPSIDGLELHAAYEPAAARATVGGDWYDVFPLSDGWIGVTVGDAMGHDLDAAVSMAQLRYMLRAYAWSAAAPDEVIRRTDELVEGTAMGLLATCVYGRLRRPEASGAPGVFEYASAGHPPQLVIHPDGRVQPLTAGRQRMLGVSGHPGAEASAGCGQVVVEPGSTLICFTDGLLSAFGDDDDLALHRLGELVAQLSRRPTGSLADLVSAVIGHARERRRADDVVVLAVRVR